MGSDAHLPFHCMLTIRDRGKAVPYGEVDRGDGGRNHGFMPLKGVVDAASSVPEARDDPALARAINVLNHTSTLFFTVGCEKALKRQLIDRVLQRFGEDSKQFTIRQNR